MPNDQEFIDFVVDQVRTGCEITYRHMFGGTTLYVNNKVVGLICNNQLFVKPTEAGRAYIGLVVEAPPYDGARNSFLIEEAIENSEWLTELLVITENALPAPKPKKKRTKKRSS
jgi:TfoX/Sxy family transcriptional regulator of competence genes